MQTRDEVSEGAFGDDCAANQLAHSRTGGTRRGLFLDMPLVTLDEYGLPPEFAAKLRTQLRPDSDLDGVLALQALTFLLGALSSFEAEVLAYAQAGL